MHRSRTLIAEELSACIRCTECLAACPELAAPLRIETLNRETLSGPISPEVADFARACSQCGACVPVCPVGLHRDAMMLWLKMRAMFNRNTDEAPAPTTTMPMPRVPHAPHAPHAPRTTAPYPGMHAVRRDEPEKPERWASSWR